MQPAQNSLDLQNVSALPNGSAEPAQASKKTFFSKKFILLGIIALIVSIAGYLIFIDPLLIHKVSTRVLGMKIDYKFYDDQRGLVYFLYPKEGKVVQEANATVIWKYADEYDETKDNAVIIAQFIESLPTSDNCRFTHKNIQACSEILNSTETYSYHITRPGVIYKINFGTKSQAMLRNGKISDDPFFLRVIHSMLISPIQKPIEGNVEFLGYKIKLPKGWKARSTTLDIEIEYFDDVISNVELTKDDHVVKFIGSWGTGRGYCDTTIFDNGEITHRKSLQITSDIYRLDFFNSSNQEKDTYLRTTDYITDKVYKTPKYEFELCGKNIQGGDSLESGSRLGHVIYLLPQNFQPEILNEMDQIIRDIANYQSKKPKK